MSAGGAADALACPVCSGRLSVEAGSARCASGHVFDVARQGYVNLLSGGVRPAAGDSAEMLDARARFLAQGPFDAIADAVVRACGAPAVVLEIGAGTAFYLARVLDAHPHATGIALDSSKYAARRAARAHNRIVAAVADTWRALPVADASIDVVLDIFAPRNAAEIARVLRPGGSLVVATPTEAHLRELVTTLGLISVDAEKTERLTATLGTHFAERTCERVEAALALEADEVADLIAMGPSARHISPTILAEKIAALPRPVAVTLSVEVRTFVEHG